MKTHNPSAKMQTPAIFASALLALAAIAQAVPTEINFQGVLTDQNGNPVNGVRAMQIKIYDAPSGGNITYTEDLGNVSVQDGIYSFSFGANGTSHPLTSAVSGISDAIIGSNQAWVETSINGVSQSPRQKILTVPYALVAKRSEDSQALTSSVSALQTQASTLSSNLTSVQGLVNGLSSDITAIYSNLTVMQSQSDGLDTSYGTLNATVGSISSNVTTLNLQSASKNDFKDILNIILDLQNKLIQVQANIASSTVPQNLISDVFSDQNGLNNFVLSNLTTASYSNQSYNAGSTISELQEINVFTSWNFVLLKTYTTNACVFQTSCEMQFDTQCYLIYKYQDGTSAQTSIQGGLSNSTWIKRIFINPHPNKIVLSVEAWVSKPSSLAGGLSLIRNFEVVKYQSVDLVVDLSSFGREIKASQLRIDGSRQSGDSIHYEIKNTNISNPQLQLGLKNTLSSSVAQPAILKITMSPAQIENFVYGGTSIRAFSLMLW